MVIVFWVNSQYWIQYCKWQNVYTVVRWAPSEDHNNPMAQWWSRPEYKDGGGLGLHSIAPPWDIGMHGRIKLRAEWRRWGRADETAGSLYYYGTWYIHIRCFCCCLFVLFRCLDVQMCTWAANVWHRHRCLARACNNLCEYASEHTHLWNVNWMQFQLK